MMKHALALIALSTLIGCQPGPKAEASSHEEASNPGKLAEQPLQTPLSTQVKDLAPWKKDVSWTYSLDFMQQEPGKQRESTQAEMTMSVNQLDGEKATIEVKNPADRELIVWQATDKGIVQVEAKDGKSKFDPPMPLVPATLKAGEEVIWKGTGQRVDSTVGPFEVRVKVLGEEEVDTNMGRMKAWSIESKAAWQIDGKPILSETRTWWSPGVGMVRMTREMIGPEYARMLVLRLKSHTVK